MNNILINTQQTVEIINAISTAIKDIFEAGKRTNMKSHIICNALEILQGLIPDIIIKDCIFNNKDKE